MAGGPAACKLGGNFTAAGCGPPILAMRAATLPGVCGMMPSWIGAALGGGGAGLVTPSTSEYWRHSEWPGYWLRPQMPALPTRWERPSEGQSGAKSTQTKFV